jgi:acetolactate synthase-1/2/3 large subunit
MPIMTTGEAAVETLLRNGIDIVYGLPGYHNDPFFDALFHVKDKIRVVHTRHEQTAGYMALGAALATGKPQVYCVVPGPGFLNSTSALLTAYAMNAPVICIAGQIPQADIDRAHGHLHEIHDQKGIASHITRYAARISAPFEAPAVLTEALRQATSGRPRPVFVECAMDMWGRRGPVELLGPAQAAANPPVDEDAAERAAKVLGAAKKPLIIVGGGALGASEEVLALAEALEAPVMAYRRGQGVIPGTHRLFINMPTAHQFWKDADVVVGIGTRLLYQHSMWGWDNDMQEVRIDIDPEEPERYRKPAAAVIADAKDGTAAVLRHLAAHNAPRSSRDAEIALHKATVARTLDKLEPQVTWAKAIHAAMPVDGLYVDEVTQVGFANRLVYPVEKPGMFFSPGYQDNLGWGLGTALGVKCARPENPVLAIAGDGGFLYQVGDLATAVLHNIAVVFVVFDNAAYGNVRILQENNFGGRLIACDLKSPDFVKMAESFGLAAFRAETPEELTKTIPKAFKLNRPALIHVPCGPMPGIWNLILLPKVRG